MQSSLLVLCAVAAVSLSAPINSYDELPAEYKDLMPPQAKEFLSGLTDADKAVLKEIAKDYAKYQNEDEVGIDGVGRERDSGVLFFCEHESLLEVLAALKEKSPELHAKAEKLHVMLKEKIDALGDEAKVFAKEVGLSSSQIIPQMIQ